MVLPSGEIEKHKLTGAEIRIGSGPGDQIRIADPEISPAQAILVRDGENYSLVDQQGRRTLVNGEAITTPRLLLHGDLIEMGKSRITFKFKHQREQLASQVVPEASARPIHTLSSTGEESTKKKEKKIKQNKGEEAGAEASQSTAGVIASDGVRGEPPGKKKKEKKLTKDKNDERVKAAMVRAWGGIAGTVLTAVLTVTVSIVMTRQAGTSIGQMSLSGAAPSVQLSNVSDSHKIKGGRFEASGAVAVPDANGILFVDDSKPDHVFYMPVNALGEQDGPIKPVPLGVSVQNPEGITQFGTRFIVTGSLSSHESNNIGGIAVFDFDATTQKTSRVVVLNGFRKFLFDNVPELKAWANKTSVEGGLNVEGIAVDPDPQHPRILLGLRGPVLNGNALVVPIAIRDRQAPLSIENLTMDEPNAIQLNLNGQAIRDIQYDSHLRLFLIISGAPETEEKTDFVLWQWTGEGNQSNEQNRPKQQTILDKKMKPEGIAPIEISNHSFVFIVGDAGSYAKVEYASP